MKVDKELMDNLKYGYEVLQDHYGNELSAYKRLKLVNALNRVNELVDEIDERLREDEECS
jgi:hypothetical protein